VFAICMTWCSITQFCALHTTCIYVSVQTVSTNSSYFTVNHELAFLITKRQFTARYELSGNAIHYNLRSRPATVLTVQARVRSQLSPCEIYCGQSGTDRSFPPSIPVFSRPYYSNSPAYCSYQRDKWESPGILQKSKALSEIGGTG
jgi:hypothetical protein